MSRKEVRHARSSDEISLQKQLISDEISLQKQLISDEISLQKQLISDEISPQKQLISDEISPPQKQSIAFTRARQRLAVSDPQLRRFPSLDPLMVELGRIKESVFGASQCSLASIALSDAELDRASHVLRGRDAHDGTTMCARMRLLREITIYMVPLFLVFWAEYACQSGAWTAFALPEPRRIDDAGSRLNAYHTFNLLYQCGVLVSRASGMLFTLPRPVLHALVVLQVALLVGFVGDAATQTITGWPLHAGALTVGLIGGTLYVQMFLLIDREMPPAKREAALATCTCADTAGVLAGEFTGLFTQFCLFDYLNLLTRGQCPWSVTPGVPITLDLTAGLAGGSPSAITVVCVKWGTLYGAEYANKLCRGVRRALGAAVVGAHFVCFTDDVDGLDADIEARPLPLRREEWKGWWHKAHLFSRAAGLEGRVLYIDLDTVIIDTYCMASLAAYDGPFATLSSRGFDAEEGYVDGYNTSVMVWEASGQVGEALRVLHDAVRPEVFQCLMRWDHWVEMLVPRAHLLQDVCPGLIVDYRSHCRASGPPEGAAVVCFPRHPKPHQVQSEWVVQHWSVPFLSGLDVDRDGVNTSLRLKRSGANEDELRKRIERDLTTDELKALEVPGLLEVALSAAFAKSRLRTLERIADLVKNFRAEAYRVKRLDAPSGEQLMDLVQKAQQAAVGLLRALDAAEVKHLLGEERGARSRMALVLAECKVTLADVMLQQATAAQWSLVSPEDFMDAAMIALRSVWHAAAIAVFPPFEKILVKNRNEEQKSARTDFKVEEENKPSHDGTSEYIAFKVDGKVVSSYWRKVNGSSDKRKNAARATFFSRCAELAEKKAASVLRLYPILQPAFKFYAWTSLQLLLAVLLTALPAERGKHITALLLVWTVQLAVLEAHEAYANRPLWAADPLNMLEMPASILASGGLILRFMPSLQNLERALLAGGILLMFVSQTLRLLERSPKIGPLVLMAQKMIPDTLRFLSLIIGPVVGIAF
ncbi:tpr domain containing protein, partial [Chrysochromulina tobinii]